MRAEVVAKGRILVAVGHGQDLFRMGECLFVLDLLDTVCRDILQFLRSSVARKVLRLSADLVNVLVFFRTSIESPVPNNVKNAILGIIKEGVTNISKHCNGKNVRLEVVENVTFWRADHRCH